MRYLSLFSGIGAPEVAWRGLGWECVGQAEIDPFCCELLRQRFPGVPNLGDVTAEDFVERAKMLGRIDLIVGGSPCQSFSVAGLRKGLHDDRGNLTLRFVEVVHGIDPEFVCWENVPGVLNHPDNPFGCFLAGLVGADAALVPDGGGPGLDDRKAGAKGRWTGTGLALGPLRSAAWRILDAQWFGVAQRRRRVFVVSGRSGDARCSEILLESAGVRGDPPARGAPRQGPSRDVAPCLGASGRGVERGGESRGQDPVVACFGGNRTGGELDVATACRAKGGTGHGDFESETFVAEKAPSLCAGGKATGSTTQQDAESGMLVASTTDKDGTGRGTPLVAMAVQEDNQNGVTMRDTAGAQMPIPMDLRQTSRGEKDTNERSEGSGGPPGVGVGKPGDPSFTLQTGKQQGVTVVNCNSTPETSDDLAMPLRSNDGSGNRQAIVVPMGESDAELQTKALVTVPGPDGKPLRDASGNVLLQAVVVPTADEGPQGVLPFDTTQITSKLNRSHPRDGDPCHPLTAGEDPPAVAFQCHGTNVGPMGTLRKGDGGMTSGVPFVAFSSKDHGADASEIAPTLRAAGHDGSHANASAPPAVAFLHCNKGRPDGRKSEHDEMVTVEEKTIPTLATDGHAQSAVAVPIQEFGKRTGKSTDDPKAGIGVGKEGDPSYALGADSRHAVAFRAAGQDGFTPSDVAPPVAATDGGGAGVPTAFHCMQDLISGDVSPCIGQGNDHGAGSIGVAFGISSDAVDRSGEGDGSVAERAGLGIVEDAVPSLRSRPTNSVAAPMDAPQSVALRGRDGGSTAELGGDTANALRSSGGGSDKEHVLAPTPASSYAIRRLTPRECCRLQGFKDDWTNVARKAKDCDPPTAGPCTKQVVTATVVSPSGKRYQATNWCMNPQKECPRAGMPSGEGCDLCRTVCAQHAHAEVNALEAAGEFARGGHLYVVGHTYACDSCLAAAKDAGIVEVIIGPPAGNASDGSRYKAIGNSMAVPVMAWIGRRIEEASR